MASPRTMKDLIHGAREETLASVVRAARREMARGGQAGGRVAGGNKKSAGAPTRDAERGVKARGALSSWTVPRTEDASCPRRPRRPTPRRVRTCGASARSLADSGTRRRVGGAGWGCRSARHVHGVSDGRGGGGLSALSAERAARARASVDHDELGTRERRRSERATRGMTTGAEVWAITTAAAATVISTTTSSARRARSKRR